MLTWTRTKAEAIAREYSKYNAVEIADAEIQQAVLKKSLASSWLSNWM